MIHRNILLPFALAVALVVVAPAAAQSSGSADFSRIVGIGDSLMSGEASGSVVETFQIHAIPAQIYRQVNGSLDGFEQALVSEPGMPPRLILGPGFTPIPIPGEPGIPLNPDLERAYDNLGMSGGIQASDLTTVDGVEACEAINDAFEMAGAPPRLGCDRVNLVLRDGGTAVEQALSLEPTFVVLWVGGNDVLRAALGGTVIEGITMTPVEAFEAAYRGAVEALTSEGADLAVANIPNVGDVPFMNTVPPVLVDPETREPVVIGGQFVPLIGPDGVPLSLADKVTLLAVEYLNGGCGVPDAFRPGYNPELCEDGYLPGSVILDVTEQGQVDDRVDAFNDIIAQVADDYGAALFDFTTLFADLNANGLNLGGIEYTSDFVTGGLVSFDAFHPPPLTAAILANGFIGAINDTFGSNIPLVDLYPYVFGSAGDIGPPVLPGLSAETLHAISTSLMVPAPGSLDALDRRPARRFKRDGVRAPALDGEPGVDRVPLRRSRARRLD